jgi:hypothetical protein
MQGFNSSRSKAYTIILAEMRLVVSLQVHILWFKDILYYQMFMQEVEFFFIFFQKT